MNNYEYIVASLPALHQDELSHIDADAIIEQIQELLSKKDKELVDTLLSGYKSENLCEEFYSKLLKSSNRFLREYFEFDLNKRNAQVEFLNRSLEREEGKDILTLEGREDCVFEQKAQVEAVLNQSDILKREKGLDDLTWQRIEDLTIFNYFDIEFILGFIAKLKILDRWIKLDPQTGRVYFRQLISELRSTFDNNKARMQGTPNAQVS